MFTEAFIGVLTDQVFSHLLESYEMNDKVRGWLRRDPQKLAFEVALTRSCARFAQDDERRVQRQFLQCGLRFSLRPFAMIKL